MKVAFRVVVAAIIFFTIISLFLFCEWLIYYVILLQCEWPQLDPKNEDSTIKKTNDLPLRILVITDLHMLGPINGYWLDQVRTDWEMHRAFQIAIKIHQPDMVFILGDLTNEGLYNSDAEFKQYERRFNSLFAVPENIRMHVLVGNHDIGFHNETDPRLTERFDRVFKTSAAQLITVRGNHFVLVNSIGLEGDGCFLCRAVESQLQQIENTLKCTRGESICSPEVKLKTYSKPILLQHFPLYRESDVNCSEPDEAPYPVKIEKFVEAYDCLSKTATDKLLQQINPRLVMDGHTHHGCMNDLPNGKGVEITVPSFNWRNKNNPSYSLVVLTPNNYAFSKCLMPRESSAIMRYIFTMSCIVFGIMYWYYRARRWKRRFFIAA